MRFKRVSGISGNDGTALATLFGLNAANTLTLANLSLLYRITQLATAAKLSLPDLSVAPLINPGAVNLPTAITSFFASNGDARLPPTSQSHPAIRLFHRYRRRVTCSHRRRGAPRRLASPTLASRRLSPPSGKPSSIPAVATSP